MKARSWWVLYGGFGTLIVLIAVLGVGAMRRAQAIHRETIAAHDAYLKTDLLVRELPADLHLSGVLVRDYLLDPSPFLGPDYRGRLKRRESEIQRKLELLRLLLPPDQGATLQRLKAEFDAYWSSLDPLFEWTLDQKAWMSRSFLREEVLPRRNAIVELAAEISRISAANMAAEQRRLQASQEAFEGFIRQLLISTVVLGLIVAGVSISSILRLEQRDRVQRERAERAEGEMRRLSQRLVHAQEEERKSISRELHDALGQRLAFAGMEISRLASAREAPPAEYERRLEDLQRQMTEAVRAVRDLSMSLRPAMLDELGLGSAVRWLARETERRSGIEVDVRIDGSLDDLADDVRTAIYRVIQEAVTNAAKHSAAKTVRISLYGGPDATRLTIQDDGVGFNTDGPHAGLGLVGIRERIAELSGSLSLRSTQGKGTILEADVPSSQPARVSL